MISIGVGILFSVSTLFGPCVSFWVTTCVITTWFVEPPRRSCWNHIARSRKKTKETKQPQTSCSCIWVGKVDSGLHPDLSSISWRREQGYLGLQTTRHCSGASSNLEQSLQRICQRQLAESHVSGWAQYCSLSSGTTTCPKLRKIYSQFSVCPVSHWMAERSRFNWACCRSRFPGKDESEYFWSLLQCHNPITQQRLVHLSQNQGHSGKGSNNGTHYMLHIPIC